MSRPQPHRPEVRLVASAQPRNRARIDGVSWPDNDPTLQTVLAMVPRDLDAWGWTLSGGEPTTRADLPELIRQLSEAGAPRLGLATDGHALTKIDVARHLRESGLERVRIGLHSGRADAHDWIAGAPGSAKRVRRAIESCAAAGLLVEAEVVITRPTTPYLSETVEYLHALGARHIHFRRPWLSGQASQASLSLSPRLGLLQPELEAAAGLARRRALSVSLHDFPHCAAPAADRHRAREGTEVWIVPPGDDWDTVRAALQRDSTGGCQGCPADCAGAPQDYVDRFGWQEFRSQGAPIEPDDAWIPAGRGGWLPATRVEVARSRSQGPKTGASTPIAELDVWLDASETTRTARVRMVHASQERPSILRLLGGWCLHPKALQLLTEAKLLYPEIHVRGELDPLNLLSDRQLKKLAGVTRFEGVLRAPDAVTHDAITGRDGSFDATISAIARLNAGELEAVIVAHPPQPEGVAAFLAAWVDGQLPGEPRFVLDGLGPLEDIESLHMIHPSGLPACQGGNRADGARATWIDSRGPELWPGNLQSSDQVCGQCVCGRSEDCAGVPSGCSVSPPNTPAHLPG